MIKRILQVFFVGCLFGSGYIGYVIFFSPSLSPSKDLIIPRGASLRSVSDILTDEGIVQHPTLFRVLMRITGGARRVRAGEFRFQEGISLFDTLRTVYSSDPIVHQITVPEGWTARQIATILSEAQLVDPDKFLALTFSSAVAIKYKIDQPTLEGFLFPDTYSFSRIDGEERIIETMVHRFFNKFKEYEKEMLEKNWTLERLVTLASIIEKETGAKEERQTISSVFHNRLKKKMRLQSDPTTIYGIPNFNGNLTKADLLRPSPFNTYVIPALPPSPIANPGMDSLVAALRPASTDFLYFVSNNHGTHIFSKTYGDHNRFVTSTQKSGRSKKQSKN